MPEDAEGKSYREGLVPRRDRASVASFLFANTSAVMLVIFLALVLALLAQTVLHLSDWQGAREVVSDHLAAIIGIPAAAVTAFVIAVLLQQTAGPMEFQGLGFKFKGAAGQVIMWVICFLAIVGAIKLIW